MTRSLMSERFGPALGNARLAQGGQRAEPSVRLPLLTNGAPGVRHTSGSAAGNAVLNDRL